MINPNQLNQKRSLLLFLKLLTFSIILSIGIGQISFAQDENNNDDNAESTQTAEVIIPPDYERLNDIQANIDNIIQKKTELEKKLKTERNEEIKAEIQQNIETLTTQRNDYYSLFEKVSLGGLDSSRFETPTTQESAETYDWQHELVQIIQPVFTEMQRMTEGPRKRDLLRSEKKEIEERISLATNGLENIKKLESHEELSQKSAKELSSLQVEWQEKLDNLTRQLDIVNNKLHDLTDNRSWWDKLQNSIWDFGKGRGLTLLLSFSVLFGLLYIFSTFINYVMRHHEQKKNRSTSHLRWRVALLAYQLITTLIAIISFMMILHSSGDMVLFGLALLILVAIIISARNSIPKYFRKLRLFLNMAQAREGERLIYNGVPYRIAHINLYTVDLVNPALDNGNIRLTVEILDNMISRPIKMDEIWFPTKVGDSIFLPDGTHAVVVRQTPESVYLDTFSSSITYPTEAFINSKPKVITTGYSLTINFGLSYDHFNLSIDDVIAKIRKSVEDHTINASEEMAKGIKSITVDFRQVVHGESMLYTVILGFGPNAFDLYYPVPRLVQKACVKAAQEHGWTMPFTEVAVHESTPTLRELPNGVTQTAKIDKSSDISA